MLLSIQLDVRTEVLADRFCVLESIECLRIEVGVVVGAASSALRFELDSEGV